MLLERNSAQLPIRNRVFCTIVGRTHLYKALALRQSIFNVDPLALFYVLAIDFRGHASPGVEIVQIEDLSGDVEIGQAIVQKYKERPDELRWSLKSVFLQHLIRRYSERDVIYCDSDFCFFSNPSEVSDYLQHAGVLLTPHWRPMKPPTVSTKSSKNFRLNFLDGLYNAGFIAANSRGIEALTWWAELCLSACEKNYIEGLYFDQRYLDLMPIYFDFVVVCKHRGYNLADWNLQLHPEVGYGRNDGLPVIPVRAVHFTTNTVKRIEQGGNPSLVPYLSQYKSYLAKADKEVNSARSMQNVQM